MSAADAIRVLVAEDEEHLGAILEHFLRGRGYLVTMCRDGRAANTALRDRAFDVALLDIVMPEMDGLEVLRSATALPSPPEIIIITGNGTIDTAITAIKLGAYDYISKPYRMAEIDIMVRRAWEKRELGKANAALRSRIAEPNASTLVPAALEARVAELAATDSAVFVIGERGAGKSALAHAVHLRSGKPADACVELTRRGAQRHSAAAIAGDAGTVGALGLAERGTLIVDFESLDDTGRDALVAHVRAAADAPRARVIVCAEPSVEARTFAVRLGAPDVTVPPLRERADELATIARTMLLHASGPARTLGVGAIDALRTYAWPGNLRELEHVLGRAALLTPREAIAAADLRVILAEGGSPDGGALSELERLHIEAMLVRHNWHQGRAAAALGISTKTLYRKMREYGFKRPRRRKLARPRGADGDAVRGDAPRSDA